MALKALMRFRIILLGLMALALSHCDGTRPDDSGDADAVVTQTFLLAVTALDHIDGALLPFTVAAPPSEDKLGLSAFTTRLAAFCTPGTVVATSANPFTVPTPPDGTGSCAGTAEMLDGFLHVVLDCTDYSTLGGGVIIDGIISFDLFQSNPDFQQFNIISEDPLGLDVSGKDCSGFLNYIGKNDETENEPFSVEGCISLSLCGPNWNLSGRQVSLP